MTTAPTKENEFKQRFAAVLSDLQGTGSRDGEVMALIGSLAADLAVPLGQSSWSGAKSVMTSETYDSLLKTFQTQGNTLHQAGQAKPAFAIQALAVSLIVATQRSDPHLAEGEKLLDAILDHAVVVHLLAGRTTQN